MLLTIQTHPLLSETITILKMVCLVVMMQKQENMINQNGLIN